MARRMSWVVGVVALGMARWASGQCSCTCDALVPACDLITAAFLNEPGSNGIAFVTAGGPGGANVEIRHANRFVAATPTEITHVCVALRSPSGGPADVATVFLAGDAAGLPGGSFASQSFTVMPTSPLGATSHQLVALATPVVVSGTFWCGVAYPTALANRGHQGVNVRTAGDSAVYIDGLGWQTYDSTGSPAYVGRAPIIRAVRVEPVNPRIEIVGPTALATSENGTSDTFFAHLSGLRPPTSDVYVNVTSSRPGEALAAPTPLVFNQFNWTVPQLITVTGQDDPLADGPQHYTIELSVDLALTSEPCYGLAPPVSQAGTNADNDGGSGCNGAWQQVSPVVAPSARFGHAMAEMPGVGVVLFGGETLTGLGLSGETWVWDGTQWTPRFPATTPAPRAGHAMVYDSVSARVLMVGGYGQGGLPLPDNTWAYDGTDWTLLNPLVLAPLRFEHALAYDTRRGRAVMLGGGDGVQAHGDIHEFDGASWLSTGGVFPASARFPAVFDSLRARTYFAGGLGAPMLTRSWDGVSAATITPLPPSGGSTLSGAGAAWDAARGRMVMFGGTHAGGLVAAHTWEFDGASWLLQVPFVPGGAPSPRERHAMAHHTSAGHTLLFGGRDTSAGMYLGDTWIYTLTSGLPVVIGPSDTTVTAPAAVSLVVTGAGVTRYEWVKDGVLLANTARISGVDTPVLTITNTDPTDEGNYWAILSNSCGSAATTSAFLDILCVADVDDGSGTGTPDGGVTIDDLLYYLDIFQIGSIDADVDDGSGTGTPDGGVTIDDLIYFLDRFQIGC